MNDSGSEFEKLVNLEGPAREVIRSNGEVRCYYPDAKVVRIEPRTFRNAFPSLSPQQQKALTDYYELRKAEADRVAGLDTQAWVFEPKDGLRYGHKFWVERATGLLLKARIHDEHSELVEQFAFTDIRSACKIDRDMVKPTLATGAARVAGPATGPGEPDAKDTGWIVTRGAPGLLAIVDGFRRAWQARARSRTSSIRMVSSRFRCSSSPSASRRIPPDSCSKAASTSSSARSTDMW